MIIYKLQALATTEENLHPSKGRLLELRPAALLTPSLPSHNKLILHLQNLSHGNDILIVEDNISQKCNTVAYSSKYFGGSSLSLPTPQDTEET